MSDAFSLTTLANNVVQDVVYSPDQSLLYASCSNGDVMVFDVATHAKVATWHVGDSLGAVSVTPDGSALLITEQDNDNGKSTLYRVSTADGSSQAFKIAGGAFSDVQVVDADHAIVTGGQENITSFDLHTSAFSSIEGGVHYANYSFLTQDGHYTLLGEPGISNGPLYLYDNRSDSIVAYGDDYQSGASSGFNRGGQAISEERGLVLQYIYYSSVNVYDLNLDFVRTLNMSGRVDGIVFDETGENAYFYLIDSGEVAQVETKNWKVVEKFAVGAEEYTGGGNFGSQLLIDDSGKYLTILGTASGKLQLIDLTVRDQSFTGTEGADAFAGGKGDDSYLVNNTGDTVVEKAGEGYDVVTASVDYTLSANVEELLLRSGAVVGSGGDTANTVRGNAAGNTLNGGGGDDLLFGQAGNDRLNGDAGDDALDGGAGADTMHGGLGDDLFVVQDAGDQATEAAGEGADLVRTSVSFTLGDNIENLTLTGGAALNGAGNGGVNLLRGNNAANALDGLDGADRLIGNGGNDTLDGGTGADRLFGGAGDDLYRVDAAGDLVSEARKDGLDTVVASVDYALTDNVERLTLAGAAVAGTGNDMANLILGNALDNVLTGGQGGDEIRGGAGADTFVYSAFKDSGAAASDWLSDFSSKDVLDLSAIDANGHEAGDGTFVRVAGDGDFTAAGQLRLVLDGGDTRVELNLDSDGDADMVIRLAGDHTAQNAAKDWIL